MVTADNTEKTLAGSSRFSSENFSYPSPYVDEGGFLRVLKQEIRGRGITMVLPVSEVTTRILLRRSDDFNGVPMPLAPIEAFELVNNKARLMKLARRLGVPAPVTHVVEDGRDVMGIKGSLTYPVVLKPASSRVFLKGGWMRATVKYASSAEELEKTVKETPYLQNAPFLLQEYVEGEGRGIFALYEDGRPVVFFGHRRIRENPPTGGVSVLSESVEVDPALEDYARRLLDYVHWHGVAMVEFKVTDDGRPYLMEINGRLWGSLHLAVEAGVDFPYLLYSMAGGTKIEPPAKYRIGVKNRWLLGDLDHLYYRLAKKVYRVGSLREGIGTVKNFLASFLMDSHSEVFMRDDMGPFRLELHRTLREIKTRLLGDTEASGEGMDMEKEAVKVRGGACKGFRGMRAVLLEEEDTLPATKGEGMKRSTGHDI